MNIESTDRHENKEIDKINNMSQKQYENTIKRIKQDLDQHIRDHNAIDIIAGYEFIGYIGKDRDGWYCDIWSWGKHHGKLRSRINTMDAVKKAAMKNWEK